MLGASHIFNILIKDLLRLLNSYSGPSFTTQTDFKTLHVSSFMKSISHTKSQALVNLLTAITVVVYKATKNLHLKYLRDQHLPEELNMSFEPGK